MACPADPQPSGGLSRDRGGGVFLGSSSPPRTLYWRQIKMVISMQEWDAKIAPILDDIAHCTGWISFYTGKVSGLADRLPSKPDWETRAQDNLKLAIEHTEQCLESLKRAQRAYTEKRID